MPVYEYKGVSATGKKTRGVVDADNAQAARAKLRKEGIFPTDLFEGQSGQVASSRKKISFGGSVGSRDLAIMTRQLSTLLSSGIPIVESLSALVEQTENVKLKRVVSDIRDKVNEGAGLADAMRQHSRIFPALYANMVMAGESSGTLDLVLDRLADFTEGQVKLKGKLIQVMAYPCIMALIGVGVMLILFTFVIPKVTSIYEGIDAVLPLPTQVLISANEILLSYWYFIPVVVFLFIYFLRAYMSKESGRYRVHQMLLNVPIFGKIIRLVAVSRFSRTLGTLISSGVPLLVSLDIVKNVVTNMVISRVIEKARKDISEGDSISGPLRKSGEFPPMVIQMIAVGERTGELESMLLKISDVYEEQVDRQVVTLTSLLEPIMIVAMAVSVGGIVMAVLLPLLELTSKVNI